MSRDSLSEAIKLAKNGPTLAKVNEITTKEIKNTIEYIKFEIL